MSADSGGRDAGEQRGVGEIDGGFGGMAPFAAGGTEGENVALDSDDGLDVILPVGAGEFVSRFEDRDGAPFDSVSAFTDTAGGIVWGSGADRLGLRVQGGLVVFQLGDQSDVGGAGDLESFFWQCTASRVTSAPAAMPSSASSV